jgi:Uma2 family endonuclease
MMGTTTVTAPPKLLTAEEFAALPEPPDGAREELIRGVVVRVMAAPGFRHGRLQLRLGGRLDTFVEEHQLGQVTVETGVITERGPDTVRGPDVAFWSKERVPLGASILAYPNVAADLCVEIRSPGDRRGEIRTKVREYLAAGVRMVWIVDPENRTLTIYRTPDQGTVLHEDAPLAVADVLPGFSCRVGDLFPPAPPAEAP